jgi:formyl-CoA transferase
LIEHQQIITSEVIQKTNHPIAGSIRQARHAAQFSATPADIRKQAPGLGEDTDEILSEAGLSDTEIADLRAAGVAGEDG